MRTFILILALATIASARLLSETTVMVNTLSVEDDIPSKADVISFWDKLGAGQYVVEGVIALLALVLCVAGNKFEKPALFTIGFFAGFGFSYVFLGTFIEKAIGEDKSFYAVVGVSVVIGIILGSLLFCLVKLGFGVAGAFLGYVLGNFLYQTVIHKLDGAGTPVWYYGTLVVCAIICTILAFWLSHIIFILATSVGGAYISVRMVGTMAGNYPDESFIAQQIASGNIDSMPPIVYVFLGIMVALAITGLVLQFKHRKQHSKHTESKKIAEVHNADGAYTKIV